MPLTERRAPILTGVALIGGTLFGVDGQASGGNEDFTSSNQKFQRAADDGSGPWTDLVEGQELEVTEALAGVTVRYQHNITDGSDPQQLIVLSSDPQTLGSADQVFFDCTLASPTATSLICVETADALLRTLPQSEGISEWLASSDNNAKKRLLNLATQIMESLCWNGERCSCEQKLSWPRKIQSCSCELASCDSIPYDIQLATAYLAAWLSTKKDYGWAPGGGQLGQGGGGSGSGGGSSGNNDIAGLEPFSQVTIGPISVTMRSDAEFDGVWGWEYLDPFLQALLWKWLGNCGPGGPGAGGATFSQGNVSRPSVARINELRPFAVPGVFSLKNGKVKPRYGKSWSSL